MKGDTSLKRGRGPVVHLPRKRKAQMIQAILRDFLNRRIRGYRILDVGTGNGEIADYFAEENEVVSIDIQDQRNRVDSNYLFAQVDSAKIPFRSGMFDIVMSHHVIEHLDNQKQHLREVRRVMKSRGVCYLGTPNRSSILMEGHRNNHRVLRYRQMGPLFRDCGFSYIKYTTRMLKQPEQFHCEMAYGRLLPFFLLNSMNFLYPSHVFLLWTEADRLKVEGRAI